MHTWEVGTHQSGKVFRIGTVCCNWPMSAHPSQAFSIAHCDDLEDLPQSVSQSYWRPQTTTYGHWWWADPKSRVWCRLMA